MTSDRRFPPFAPNGPESACHVILVHGTIPPYGSRDRTAAWTLAGSRLRRIMELNVPGTTFTVFKWSGKNSHAHRHAAAAELGGAIRMAAEDHPAARLFIIGHSHGGNVGLYAMADAALRGKVQGIITLNTPFMTAVQRNAYSLVRGILALLFPIVAVTFYPFFAYLNAVLSGQVTWASFAIVGVLIGYASYALVLVFLSRLGLLQTISRRVSALVDELRGPQLRSLPVTSIWRASDEIYDTAQLLDALISVLYFLRRPIALPLVAVLLFVLHEKGILCVMPFLHYIPYIGSLVEASLRAGGDHPFLAEGSIRSIAWLYSSFMWLWIGLIVTDFLALLLYRCAYGIDSAPLLLAPYLRMVVGLTPPNAQDVTFREVHTSVENRNHSPSDDDWMIQEVIYALRRTPDCAHAPLAS